MLELLNKETGAHQTGPVPTEGEARSYYLLNTSPVVVYICNPGGEYAATFISENIKDQLGYEPNEFLEDPKFWADHIHPEDRPRVFAELPRLFERGCDVHEYRFKCKDGTYRWIHDELRLVLDQKGNPLEIIGYWIDITERREAEEALKDIRDELERRIEERTFDLRRANERLQQEIMEHKRTERELRKVYEELKNFVRIISHDLKTPLISIRGLASQLLKKYQEGLVPKGQTYLRQIVTTTRRMELLVSDLGAFLTVGRVVPTFEDVPCSEVIKDVTSYLRESLLERDIQLIVGPNLPNIYCDRIRIYQVFENLLVNAIKYLGDTRDPRIEIGCENEGDFYRFYVRDNGIGISSKYHRRIFKAFQRVKEVKGREGTGLGLAIVERIVSNHGGKVWVESEEGKGATFYFTLHKGQDVKHS